MHMHTHTLRWLACILIHKVKRFSQNPWSVSHLISLVQIITNLAAMITL